jgi:type II secretory pathway pseudopilin PulG
MVNLISIIHRRRSKPMVFGYSLFEALIYLALFVLIGGVVMATALRTVTAASRVRMMTATLDNARRAIYTVSQEVAHASDVYIPTSALTTSPGQLSLVTTRHLPAGETSTYADFFVDNGRLYLKRENQADELITSDQVIVESLTFTYLGSATYGPGVQTRVTIVYNTERPEDQALTRVTLVASRSIRAYAP